ncbi:unnamed protein product [Tuber melanosporum]|uniref:(Perigord truffle) hypothetical protein n=1 Tax=Tuber melanosporum (strain Mel28) TaxID=656061 RepID=D5GC64_TUBMM|nr:uncharacterized protein GSTUM_00000602001 [Tuber melanosporum]CAZ82107.1 unnamed protein product [Tuber melanosporum]
MWLSKRKNILPGRGQHLFDPSSLPPSSIVFFGHQLALRIIRRGIPYRANIKVRQSPSLTEQRIRTFNLYSHSSSSSQLDTMCSSSARQLVDTNKEKSPLTGGGVLGGGVLGGGGLGKPPGQKCFDCDGISCCCIPCIIT